MKLKGENLLISNNGGNYRSDESKSLQIGALQPHRHG